MDNLRAQFNKILDDIYIYHTEGERQNTLFQAKDFYFRMTGNVDKDSSDFENKMISFTEWFVLNFTPGIGQEKVYEIYFREVGFSEEILKLMNSVEFSLFQFNGKSLWGSQTLTDLLAGQKKVLAKDADVSFIFPKEIFVGRLMSLEGKNYLLRGICSLPINVKSKIMKQCKRVKRKKVDMDESEFLLSLEGMRYKAYTYAHVPAEKIFNF
ncbi:MAG: hypothetical protein QE271_05695 [Bacteriovoracaceae bacterium]|nr:hypothetical protein [Bacteriovoracaceae bacterium]